ncbi:unnamed protein product [Acanthoscelides obtectus]|uniref:Uncharacterized protein n=1 Tax=Acanthoscelides obtectus TaxID=200917 RepID=A0A9P0Q5J6_ACAOB|nr:unnamed protein product [Acanthoscelides obtectus]
MQLGPPNLRNVGWSVRNLLANHSIAYHYKELNNELKDVIKAGWWTCLAFENADTPSQRTAASKPEQDLIKRLAFRTFRTEISDTPQRYKRRPKQVVTASTSDIASKFNLLLDKRLTLSEKQIQATDEEQEFIKMEGKLKINLLNYVSPSLPSNQCVWTVRHT